MTDYNQNEKNILSYLSKLQLSKKLDSNYLLTEFLNFKFSKSKVDETWFQMNREELIEFLEKRNDNNKINVSFIDKLLHNTSINPNEDFFVNFY